MNSISEKINDILSEWDPLDVGNVISLDEYRGYIPMIIKNSNERETLIVCLENILINYFQAGYDKKNIHHKNSINQVVEKIMSGVANLACIES